jgi:hypothetical protein
MFEPSVLGIFCLTCITLLSYTIFFCCSRRRQGNKLHEVTRAWLNHLIPDQLIMKQALYFFQSNLNAHKIQNIERRCLCCNYLCFPIDSVSLWIVYSESAHKPTSQQWANSETSTVIFYIQPTGPQTLNNKTLEWRCLLTVMSFLLIQCHLESNHVSYGPIFEILKQERSYSTSNPKAHKLEKNTEL